MVRKGPFPDQNRLSHTDFPGSRAFRGCFLQLGSHFAFAAIGPRQLRVERRRLDLAAAWPAGQPAGPPAKRASQEGNLRKRHEFPSPPFCRLWMAARLLQWELSNYVVFLQMDRSNLKQTHNFLDPSVYHQIGYVRGDLETMISDIMVSRFLIPRPSDSGFPPPSLPPYSGGRALAFRALELCCFLANGFIVDWTKNTCRRGPWYIIGSAMSRGTSARPYPIWLVRGS